MSLMTDFTLLHLLMFSWQIPFSLHILNDIDCDWWITLHTPDDWLWLVDYTSDDIYNMYVIRLVDYATYLWSGNMTGWLVCTPESLMSWLDTSLIWCPDWIHVWSDVLTGYTSDVLTGHSSDVLTGYTFDLMSWLDTPLIWCPEWGTHLMSWLDTHLIWCPDLIHVWCPDWIHVWCPDWLHLWYDVPDWLHL